MPDNLLYEYAVIRVVPKVEREEFINIGVILMSKESDFLRMKTHVNEAKLKALSTELEADMIKGCDLDGSPPTEVRSSRALLYIRDTVQTLKKNWINSLINWSCDIRLTAV